MCAKCLLPFCYSSVAGRSEISSNKVSVYFSCCVSCEKVTFPFAIKIYRKSLLAFISRGTCSKHNYVNTQWYSLHHKNFFLKGKHQQLRVFHHVLANLSPTRYKNPFKVVSKNIQFLFTQMSLSWLNLLGHGVESSLAIDRSEAADVRANLWVVIFGRRRIQNCARNVIN